MTSVDGFDLTYFKIRWEQQPNGLWDKVLYKREREVRHYGTKGHLKNFEIDRYLESNVSNEEYFMRKLTGEIK